MVLPMNMLQKSLEKKVTVVLKDSRILEGVLKGFDEYMNMVLQDAKEMKGDEERLLGTLILRGNNVVSIYPSNAITYTAPPGESGEAEDGGKEEEEED
ncbi:MAG: RNA-binding protein [Thermoplasmata archaeon]|nr:RNA-binding protein [Thermoplasmata archaeon]